MAVTFDSTNKGANAVLSNGDLTVGTTTDFTWHQALSTNYHTTGKKYVEIEFTEDTAAAYNMSCGFNDGTHSLTTYIGDNAGAIGYMSNGRYYREGSLITGKTAWNTGPVTVMMAIDCDTGKVWFGIDGTWDGDPGAGTGEVFLSALTGNIYVAAASYHTDGYLTANFSTSSQTYTAPSGFDAWGTEPGTQVLDTIELNTTPLSATVIRNNPVNYWSEGDLHSPLTVSGGGVTIGAFSNSGGWKSGRSLRGDISGKFYSEHVIQGVPYVDIGIGEINSDLDNYAGHADTIPSYGWIEQVAAVRYNTSNVTATTFSADNGDTIGMAVDIDNLLLYYSKNGVWQFSADPSNGTGGIDISNLSGKEIYAMASFSNIGTIAKIDSNFGHEDFTYTKPTGFTAWREQTTKIPNISFPYSETFSDMVSGEIFDDVNWTNTNGNAWYDPDRLTYSGISSGGLIMISQPMHELVSTFYMRGDFTDFILNTSIAETFDTTQSHGFFLRIKDDIQQNVASIWYGRSGVSSVVQVQSAKSGVWDYNVWSGTINYEPELKLSRTGQNFYLYEDGNLRSTVNIPNAPPDMELVIRATAWTSNPEMDYLLQQIGIGNGTATYNQVIDDFIGANDTSPDTSLWTETAGETLIQSNSARQICGAGENNNVLTYTEALSGDFVIITDWNLINGPSTVWWQSKFKFAWDTDKGAFMGRLYNGAQQYRRAWNDGTGWSFAAISSTASEGRFMASRIDDTLQIWYDEGSGFIPWTVPVTCTNSDPVTMSLELQSSGTASTWDWNNISRNIEIEQSTSFSTNFDEYTLSQQPFGWSELWNVSDGSWTIENGSGNIWGSKVLRRNRTSDGRCALTLNAFDGTTDVEIIALSRTNSDASTVNTAAGCGIRMGGTDGSEDMYSQTMSSYDDIVKYRIYNAGGTTTLQDKTTLSWTATDWVWHRIRISGTNLKMKTWLYNTSEPSWDVEGSYPQHSSGKLGVFTFDGTADEWDYFAVETNSNNWPIPIPSAASPDITIDTDLQTLTFTQFSPALDLISNANISLNVLSQTLTQYGLSTSVDLTQDLNVLNQTLTQYGSTVDTETSIDFPLNTLSQSLTQYSPTLDLSSNIDMSLNVLNQTLTQLNASVTTSHTEELDTLGLTVNPETPMVCIGADVDLNTLTLTKVQPSATLVINPDVFINLNTLQQQLIINSVTLGIINKLIFPITGGLDKSSGTSITKGLERRYNPNTFIKGLELVKRENNE